MENQDKVSKKKKKLRIKTNLILIENQDKLVNKTHIISLSS